MCVWVGGVGYLFSPIAAKSESKPAKCKRNTMESKDRVVRSGRFTVRKMAMNKKREAKNDSKLCKETKPSTETTGDEREREM